MFRDGDLVHFVEDGKKIENTFWDYPAFKDQNGETAEQFFMEEDFKFTVYEDPKKRSSPPGKYGLKLRF